MFAENYYMQQYNFDMAVICNKKFIHKVSFRIPARFQFFWHFK